MLRLILGISIIQILSQGLNLRRVQQFDMKTIELRNVNRT